MAINLNSLLRKDTFTVLVNFRCRFKGVSSSLEVGIVSSKKTTSMAFVDDYLKEETLEPLDTIKKILPLVRLDETILDKHLKYLTLLELKKVRLAKVLLLKSHLIICDHFFEGMIDAEKDYFRRLLRNLIYKQQKQVILMEEDMNFVCETVKEFYLFTKNEKHKLIQDFYEDEIYKYVKMPHTVEVVKYLEDCGYEIDHEITFNETLKAIYRGVA